jgi:hypothetical protein
MNKDYLRTQLIYLIDEAHVESIKKYVEFKIDDRALITVDIIPITSSPDKKYLTKVQYLIDNTIIHLETANKIILKNIIDTTFIDEYFNYNLWSTICAQGSNNLDGLIFLIHELSKIESMDILMHLDYHKNQWKARNPQSNLISNDILNKNDNLLTEHQKKYKKWLNEGIKKGYFGKDNYKIGEIVDDYLLNNDE